MPSNHLILWCFLLLLLSIFPSIRDFSKESSIRIRWPKYCRFSFSINPYSECSGPISLKIDCFDLLAVQGTFRSLLQHHSLKSSILWRSVFFMVQLSQLYMTTGNIIAFTMWTFVGKVSAFQQLPRFVITFLPRSNCFLISWVQSLSTVILEPKKRKSVTAPTFSPSICHAVTGSDAMILVFLILSLKPELSLFSFALIKRLFSSSLLSAIRVVSSAYLRLLMFLRPILIPACNSSSPALLMMCSAHRLNHRVTQAALSYFLPGLEQPVVSYSVLTVASWPACRFLRRQGP